MDNDRRNNAELFNKLNALATKRDIGELTKTVREHIDKTCTVERISIHSEIATLKANAKTNARNTGSLFGFISGLVATAISLFLRSLLKTP